MVGVKMVLGLYLATALFLDSAELGLASSLHAILGIDWTRMESRATYGQCLTNKIVPEVLWSGSQQSLRTGNSLTSTKTLPSLISSLGWLWLVGDQYFGLIPPLYDKEDEKGALFGRAT